MNLFSSFKKPVRVLTAVVLTGGAVLMTRAAVAYECPQSAYAVCPNSFGSGTTFGPETHCLTGAGTSIGTVRCGMRTVIPQVNPKFPTQSITYSTGVVTATSTAQIQGKMTCNGSVKTWSVVPSADPNHPPVSHSTTCSGAPIHSVSCRGIAVPIACQ